MGNLSQSFKCMCTIFFFLLSYTSASHQEIQVFQPQNPSRYHHQVFYLKNTPDSSTYLSKQELLQRFKKRRILKRNNKKHRKKMVKNNNLQQSSRTFSVMLPKGFVPPSGSSPCHNDQPNSVTSMSSFHCHLSTAQQP